MAAQPAWARYQRLQGALMSTGDRTAAIVDRWAAEAAGGDVDGSLDAAERRASHPHEYEPAAGGPAAVDAATEERPQVGRVFVLAGNAYLTLQGTEDRYTFRVAQGKPREGDQPDRSQPFFLSLLTGPDNTADYQYIGIVDQQTGRVRLTRASRMREDSKPVAAWNWVMARVFAGRPYAPATVHHAGRCGRCGRLLTVPSSIETGFGPECSGKLGL